MLVWISPSRIPRPTRDQSAAPARTRCRARGMIGDVWVAQIQPTAVAAYNSNRLLVYLSTAEMIGRT